ncbi:MAG: rhodanese-like domain-containing protein [Syntrophomonadales bacterium]
MVRNLLITVLLLAVVMFTGCQGGQEKIVYQEISPQEAQALLEEGQDVILLDVRTEEEFQEKRIPGSVLIPDYDLAELAAQKLPDKDATILVYCRTGRRSEASSRQLIEMGYTRVYDLGGIVDWPYETVSGSRSE